MGLLPNTRHLRRYKDITRLLLRYGRSDLVQQAGLDTALGDDQVSEEGLAQAGDLADDLEQLGPTFIKLGQMLSTRVDLLPMPYLEPLARLQDRVAPFDSDDVQKIVRSELGVRISKAFEHFDLKPIAAASLGQVHRATLRDGRQVAVKVQRPGIRQVVADDLEAIAEVVEMIDRHTELGRTSAFGPMVDIFRKRLMLELDYRVEAGNLRAFQKNLERFDRIRVPSPIDDYSTSRVLTMDYIKGVKIDTLSPLVRADIGGPELAEELFHAYLHQILVAGLFHADPHPGNVFLTPDHRIALIDLGMVGRVMPSTQVRLLELLIAIGEGDSEGTAAIALRLGQELPDADNGRFRREIHELVARHAGDNLENLAVGKIVLQVFSIASSNKIRIPPELSVLGKALLQLDEIGKHLDPEFQPRQSIRRHAAEIAARRLRKESSLRQLFSTAVQTKEFVEALPDRINRVLDTFSGKEIRIDIKAFEQDLLMRGFQKIANRITAGLVLAALIVGAALLMRIETSFTLFGYPGLAIICFLAAAGGGFWLVGSIFWGDRTRGRPPET